MQRKPTKAPEGMTVREAGRKGGQTVKQRYGSEFYERIGRKGGEATKSSHGHEFYENIGKLGGKKGGESTRDRYGPAFYEKIGQIGGQNVKKLIEEGKKDAKKPNRSAPERGRLVGLPVVFQRLAPARVAKFTQRLRFICRMRSRVTPNSDRPLPASADARLRARSAARDFALASVRLRSVARFCLSIVTEAASAGATASGSSMKSPRWLSSSAPIGVSSEIGSCAIFITSLTLSGERLISFAISSTEGSRPSSCSS